MRRERVSPTSFLARAAVHDWRAVTLLFGTSTLLESLAIGHLTAFTPLFLRQELGVAPDEVGTWTGLLTAATFAVAFPLAPLWGALAERYSRKLIIVRSQYIEAFAYVLCGLSPDLRWFFVARLLLGLTFGNIAIIIATQSLLTPDRRMGTAIAVVQGANPVAVSVGPPLGALLLPWLGLRGLLVADGAACLLAAVLVTLFMPEPPGRNTRRTILAHMRETAGLVWRQPVVRLNFVAWYLTRGAMAVVDTYLPVRIAELMPTNPAPAIGLVLGVFGAVTTVATWATGRLVDRFGAARLFWPAMVVAALSVLGTALAPAVWLLAVANWLRAVPVALTGTGLYAHLSDVVERPRRAQVMSLTPVPRNLAQFTWPLLAAPVALLGSGAALLLGAAAYAAAAWVGRRLLAETAAQQDEREAALAGRLSDLHNTR
jgi:MFS transporter, DHA1 family, multidrug resistance protein